MTGTTKDFRREQKTSSLSPMAPWRVSLEPAKPRPTSPSEVPMGKNTHRELSPEIVRCYGKAVRHASTGT